VGEPGKGPPSCCSLPPRWQVAAKNRRFAAPSMPPWPFQSRRPGSIEIGLGSWAMLRGPCVRLRSSRALPICCTCFAKQVFETTGNFLGSSRRDVAAMLPMREQVSVNLCPCSLFYLEYVPPISSPDRFQKRNKDRVTTRTDERTFPFLKSLTQKLKLNAAVQIEF